MRKKLVAVSLLAASSMIATEAMAEVGFQFRIPFQVTKAAGISNYTGTSTLLTFDVDPGTTVGILNENASYTNAAAVAVTTTASALRVQKNVIDVVNVGLDIGNITSSTPGSGAMADVFGGAKLLSSKGGKVSSYMNAELLYRIANMSAGANLGGIQLSIAAGVNF